MTCVEIGDGDGRLKMYVKVAWLGFDTRIRQFTKGLSVTSSWVNVVYLNINYCLNFSSLTVVWTDFFCCCNVH